MNIEEIKNKYKDLINTALRIIESFGDPIHGIGHIEGVVENTILLLEKYPEANKEVCILCAYWHAVARKDGKEGYRLRSAKMLKEELVKLNCSSEFIEQCFRAVCMDCSKEKPGTIEENIVKDAENIDAIGVRRWRDCVDADVRTPRIIPTIRENLILDYSKEIYDKRADAWLEYLKSTTKK